MTIIACGWIKTKFEAFLKKNDELFALSEKNITFAQHLGKCPFRGMMRQ
jgi:hypothetical protein